MSQNDELLAQLIKRADALIDIMAKQAAAPRVEPPDWNASVAYRYRRYRDGRTALVPVPHVASCHWMTCKRSTIKSKDTAQHRTLHGRLACQ